MVMISNKNKKRKDNKVAFFSVILGLIALSVVAFLAASNWKINQKRSALNSRIENLKQEIRALEEKNDELKAGIVQSLSQEYLEKIARENLNYKKEGEEVVVVKPQETVLGEAAQEEKSFWQKIKEKIGF